METRHSHSSHGSCGCAHGSIVMAESFLEMDFGRSLEGAALAGNIDRMRTLIEKGASIDGHANDGYAPLHYAARRGHLEACRLLLQHGAQVDIQTRAGKATSLHRASYGGHEEIVRLLLSYGANPSALDSDGCTPAHKAAIQGHSEIVKLLSKESWDAQELLGHQSFPSS